ncbi:ComEC/Rec2 family competence protein [Victivallaceae bacterium BBE-744-WT-12]|uniref:ComEC/Rec2 family competence protein n=2 Tax=Victivallis lenta TaxID=2606640 RepID=A0A844G052_9BACT|nr:ComEC/Rec2 family competence protein [Victivallis lenta]MST96533.1 ComEC/Rec2 family competence protein [Victivallis lenta]
MMHVPFRRIRCRLTAPGALFPGILAGALPATLDGRFLPWGAVVAVAAAAAALLLLERRCAAVALAGIGLGTASIGLHALWEQRPGAYETLLPPRSCGGTAELRIADPRVSSVPGITPPSLIRAQVRRIRLTGETGFRNASGVIYLKLPAESPPAVRCGDLLTAEGVFVLPEPGGVFRREHGGTATRITPMRDFSTYLAGRGASRTFRAREAAVTGRSPGMLGRICLVRDRLLERAVSGIGSARIRNLAAALFFGTSGGVDPANRLRLIESGTIHLYSVSGMHVAMLAAVLLWLLRPLPFRSRYLTLAALVLLYVLSTGANAPAMRAFYMIGLWCVLRASLLYIPPFHALLLAGGILILVSPGLMLDMGFQYSFLITAILILASGRFDRAAELLGEEFRCMPNSRFKRRREKRLRRGWALLFAAGACFAAFLGGAGISLHTQGLLLPGSVLANLALMPVVGLLFPILFFKLGGGLFWSGFDWFGARLLEFCFGFMETVTRIAATGLERLPAVRPSLPEIVLFYAALFLLIAGRRRAVLFPAAALLVLLPSAWLFRAEFRKPSLLVVAGGGSTPMVVFHHPGTAYTAAVNADGYGTVPAAADFLLKRGATHIDRLAFSAARTGNLSALPLLVTRLPVSELSVPELDRYSRVFTAKLAETLPGCRLTTPADGGSYGPLAVTPNENGFELAYSDPSAAFEWRLSLVTTDSGCAITLRQPGREATGTLIPNSSVPEVWEHEFR